MKKTVFVSKLNLACGKEYLEGYWNVDNCEFWSDIKVDQKANIFDLKWKENTLDEIKLSHFMMYLRPEDALPLFRKWYTWLKKGGRLIIETIDLQKVCKIVVEENDFERLTTWGLVNLFGTFVTGPHRWGWTKQALTTSLYHSGFNVCETKKGNKKPNRDFQIIATK